MYIVLIKCNTNTIGVKYNSLWYKNSVQLCEPSVVLCETKKITQSCTEKTQRFTENNKKTNKQFNNNN